MHDIYEIIQCSCSNFSYFKYPACNHVVNSKLERPVDISSYPCIKLTHDGGTGLFIEIINIVLITDV